MACNTLQALLSKQDRRCFFCNVHIDEHEADLLFLQPLEAGGLAHEDNAVACCRHTATRLTETDLKTKLALLRQGACLCASQVTQPVASTPDMRRALPEAAVERLRQRQFG